MRFMTPSSSFHSKADQPAQTGEHGEFSLVGRNDHITGSKQAQSPRVGQIHSSGQKLLTFQGIYHKPQPTFSFKRPFHTAASVVRKAPRAEHAVVVHQMEPFFQTPGTFS